MADTPRLPSSYIPIKTLEICSNTFVDVPTPIAIGSYPILLIGKGEGKLPVVWLAAPDRPHSSNWVFVVEKNRSLNAALLVKRRADEADITVYAGNTIVLRVEGIGPTHARIVELDLRPLGLAVVGNSNGLQIGGASFTHNRIEHSAVGLALG